MTQQGPAAVAAPRPVAAIILAAGRSTRMKSDLPKVMHEICGRPMLAYVLDACREADISECHVVVGHGRQAVVQVFAHHPGLRFVEQAEQKGTGHAVSMCAQALAGFGGDLVVIAGDMPMVRAETLRTLLSSHRAAGAAASLATTVLEDPAGYGRIVRDRNGEFERVVEHRDCTEDQLAIREVNPSYYCFDARTLFEALPRIRPDNAKGEYYLTDVLAIIRAAGKPVRAAAMVPAADAVGINSRADLAEVSRLMQRRIQRKWMDQGVTIVDPDNTWIDSRARIGPDTVLRPFCYVEGPAQIGSGCTIGPFAYISGGAQVADGAVVGPGILTALDPSTTLRHHGSLAEKKNVQVTRRPPAQSGCS